MTIDVDTIQDLFFGSVGDTFEDWTLKSKEMYDKTRWSIVHLLVVEKDGAYYQLFYEEGATEYQEVGEQDFDLTRVYPHKVTTTVYKKEP